MAKEFTYDVKNDYGMLSENKDYSLRLTKVSWNGGDPKFDLRSWCKFGTEEQKASKGITLTVDEAKALRDLLNEIDLEDGNS